MANSQIVKYFVCCPLGRRVPVHPAAWMDDLCRRIDPGVSEPEWHKPIVRSLTRGPAPAASGGYRETISAEGPSN